MKRRKNKKTALILVLILLISVGYAALASNLKINGSSNVKASSWNVYWDNVQIKDGSVPADNNNKARITDSAKTQVEFNVVLSEPGDFYEFTVDAVNNGTIDAMIAENGIVNEAYTDSTYETKATLPKVLKYTVTYADGTAIEAKHLLAKKTNNTPTAETYKVRVEYSEDIEASDLDNANDQTFYFKFSVNYVQADNSAVAVRSAIHYVSRQNEGQITPGDVIGIGETEDFYVVSSDAQKTVLLAKYNLLVGGIYEYDNHIGDLQPTDPGYGLQSVEATGYVSTGIWKGTVAFSNTNYWDDGNGTLLSPYNENGASYSANPYPYVYDSNSNIYQYISGPNGYISKLIEMGAPSTITGRLLAIEEVNIMENSIAANEMSIIYSQQSYWLGTVEGADCLLNYSEAISSGIYCSYNYDSEAWFGIRPVIEIPTSEIK